MKTTEFSPGNVRRVAAHLVGYSTLLIYIIWQQRRTGKQSAG